MPDSNLGQNGYVTKIVTISVDEIIDCFQDCEWYTGFDSFLDLISEKACGSILMQDITYGTVGEWQLEVRGDVSEIEYESDTERE
jgi:hypothetical protein